MIEYIASPLIPDDAPDKLHYLRKILSAKPPEASRFPKLASYTYARQPKTANRRIVGIASPGNWFEGGAPGYAAAFQSLTDDLRNRTFVLLCCSHYGECETFGLARRPFKTPLGTALVDVPMADYLIERAPESVIAEDDRYWTEYSVHLPLLLLQARFGADISILPILCGAFASSLNRGGVPEDSSQVAAFFEALRSLGDVESDRIFWVVDCNMAHMGKRFGSDFAAVPYAAYMSEVAEQDAKRLAEILDNDPHGLWELIQEGRDLLKWSCSAPLYTFLSVNNRARAILRHYDQVAIDDQSVTSYAALTFEMEIYQTR